MRFITINLLLSCLMLGCSRETKPVVPNAVINTPTSSRSTISPSKDSPIWQLVEYLQSKGFPGEYVALPAGEVAGLGERGSFVGKGFRVTFFHFADSNLASSVAAEGIKDRKCYANGPFVMEVAMADEAFVNAFLAYP